MPWGAPGIVVGLTLFFGASFPGSELSGTGRDGGPNRPNILLICVDDLKPALGCYGDRLAKTPNIDRLAARGIRFELAFCNQAVCAPSRNALLLGSRSTSLGIYSLSENFRKLWPGAVTLPQYFKQHGWWTEAVGKVFHTGHGNHEDPASWSAPPFVEKVVEYLDPAQKDRLTREEAYFSNQLLDRIATLPRGMAWENLDVPDTAYADGRIAEEGIRRLRMAKRRLERENIPFFLALGFVKPHLPFTAPKRYWDLYDAEVFTPSPVQEAPRGAPPFAGKRGGEILNYEPLTETNLATAEIQRMLIHGYYAAVSYVDAQIGKVLNALEELRLEQSTIIVLWGDNGFHLGDHGIWTKHTNYEQAVRIPLIIVAPGVTKPGSVTRQVVENVDLFPTLLELAGLPPPSVPQPLDGVSLVPVLACPDARVDDHAYHCYPRGALMGRAIRTERYRLVEWKKIGDPPSQAVYELYDYAIDPEERENLASKLPEVVRELRQILARHPEAKPSAG
ncbi:MAG: sulfatase [Thermoguttaceae bacterium]|nr:sulfatase [Thermoguttaceae bacterium]MDW8077428.1 sulfatase [Thermoguttaceae bacterium]